MVMHSTSYNKLNVADTVTNIRSTRPLISSKKPTQETPERGTLPWQKL